MKKSIISLTLATLAMLLAGCNETAVTPTNPSSPVTSVPDGIHPATHAISIPLGEQARIPFQIGGNYGMSVTVDTPGAGPVLNFTDTAEVVLTIDTRAAMTGDFILTYHKERGGVVTKAGTITVTVTLPAGKHMPVWLPDPASSLGQNQGVSAVSWLHEPVNAQEAELLTLINEVRVQGTLGGQPALTGSCVDGTFKAGTLRALTFNAAAGVAAQRHSLFMAKLGYSAHQQPESNHPAFYGTSITDRIQRASHELNLRVPASYAENAAANQATPVAVMRSWILSPGHCVNLFSPTFTSVGVGYSAAVQGTGPTGRTIYPHNWTQVFAADRGVDLLGR